jgi:two-component system, OmpR family, sensor kinase
MTTPTAAVLDAGARWLRPSRWTLRARLVVSMLALLALVSLVIGSASAVALHHYMTNQVWNQVTGAADRGLGLPGHDDHNGRGPIPGQGGPADATGQGPDSGSHLIPGTLTGVWQNGQWTTAPHVVNDNFGENVLPTADQQSLLAVPVSRSQHSVDLGDPYGSYLVVADRMPDGSIQLTGLPLGYVEDTLHRLVLVFTLVTLLGLLVAAVAGTVIVRLSLRPLDRLAATAARVSELPLDRGDVSHDLQVVDADTDPGTEVGQVGAALDRMLGHVFRALQVRNASEARMRRFVADASHELRTPLASIRGYAELTLHRGGDLTPEVEHALSRVESEAIRMTGLVEDLLLLARLDDGATTASLRWERVDLSAVAVDCVSDAHVLGDRHRWLLELPEDPVTLTGDAARLRQVVTNLLANARVHTPPGTTVTVRLTGPQPGPTGRPEVRLEVADDGPGIPPSLLPEVFDRFSRADSSRSRAAGSTGLGLSIVASVVEAHEGRVEVASRPGRTTFTVHLPVAPAGGPLADATAPDHLAVSAG